MDKINEILKELTLKKGKGNQKKVADELGFKPQTFGNYLKGRKIPGKLIQKWREVYGEDLVTLSTNVSHETVGGFSARDIVESEHYIGMHRRVYDTLEKNMDTHRILMMQMSETIKNLTGNQGGSPGGKQVSLPRE